MRNRLSATLFDLEVPLGISLRTLLKPLIFIKSRISTLRIISLIVFALGLPCTSGLSQASAAEAAAPDPWTSGSYSWEMTVDDLVNASQWKIKPATPEATEADPVDPTVELPGIGRVLELDAPLNLETYGLQGNLTEGWWKMSVRVHPDRKTQPGENMEFSMWNVHGKESSFRFTTVFPAAEFGPGDRPVTLTRIIRIGPDNGNLGMFLRGGWKGLRVEGIRFEELTNFVTVVSAQAERLVYRVGEEGIAQVKVFNSSSTSQKVHLLVEVQSGLAAPVKLHDADIVVPSAGAEPHVVKIKIPVLPEYGQQLRAEVRSVGPEARKLGEAWDWFYVIDRPVRVGHLANITSSLDYEPKMIDEMVAGFRRKCFPLAEMTFWAPDDFMQLVPPEGEDRWWSGQTLAQLSTETIKARIAALHGQGMKVLSYVDLRLDFGFRVVELFRQRPEWSQWDLNGPALAFSPEAMARQLRQDDNERFSPAEPNKPLFLAEGVFTPMTGNPAVVQTHIDQLVASAKLFDWDGFRYDDYVDYDFKAVDMLGNQMPYKGFTVPVLTAKMREAIEQVNPEMIFGRNMEWTPRVGQSSGVTWVMEGDSVPTLETAMPLDSVLNPVEDYYVPHLRNDGLQLQERATAYLGDHSLWESIAENLNRLGSNAARRGGHAYAITPAHNWAVEGRTITAMMMAGRVHLCYYASEYQIPYLRLATSICELLYGSTLQPAPVEMLQVNAKGGREVWWQRYVRVLEPAPGKRTYLVHLINPPVQANVDTKTVTPPPPATNLELKWTLPNGWKADEAWLLTADQSDGLVTTVKPNNPEGTNVELTFVTADAIPHREVLPMKPDGNQVTVTVPAVSQWTIVAVTCSGPATDKLPEWKFPLPPLPNTDGPFTTEKVAIPQSPNTLKPVVFGALHPGWVNKMESKPEFVQDPSCTDGRAIVLKGPLNFETYFGGVRGGLYRYSLRVKAPASASYEAPLKLSTWGASQVWRKDAEFPVDNLQPDVWTDLVLELEVEDDRGNCAVVVTGLWEGLLIDRIEVREISQEPDTLRFETMALRPWPEGLAPDPKGGALCINGLWHEKFGISDALKALDVQELAADWFIYRDERGWSGPQLKSPEDLAKFRLLVLSNFDLRTFSLEQREWIRGWVYAGGRLLINGGPYGFGSGWWQESEILSSIMPASFKPYDLQKSDAPRLLAGAGPLRGLKLPASASTLWMHELEPKSGAEIGLTADGKPALILGKVGSGRVALLAIAPLGEETPGAWWTTEAGRQITEATLRLLLGKP